MPTEINPKAVEAAQAALNAVDPYVPKVAKDAAAYAVHTFDPYVPNIAKSAATYAINTATTLVENTATNVAATQKSISESITATQNYASAKVTETLEFGKVAVNGATTTITAYTPTPVVTAVTGALDGARALRSDPVGTVKPYIPTFVINIGEKSYEVVVNTVEATKDNISKSVEATKDGISKTTGFIVTKVNGTVHAITEVPQIHALIEQIQKLLAPVVAPVVARINGGKKEEASAAPAESE